MRRRDEAGARRYARALLDVARRAGTQAALRDELQAASTRMTGHPELQAALTHPTLSGDRKACLAEAVWRDGSPLLRRLLEMLAGRDRLGALPAIAEAYAEAWNAEQGVVAAEVTSAAPLDAATVAALAEALGRAAGARVALTTAQDPALLGGVLVRMGGRTYDGSVRGRLRALRERLARGF